MNITKMIEIALNRAVALEMQGDIEKANHFLEIAIRAEEKLKGEEDDKPHTDV